MTEQLEVTGKVVHESSAPVEIKVERGQRGGYGWEIKVKGSDPAAILASIDHIDRQLRQQYFDTEGNPR